MPRKQLKAARVSYKQCYDMVFMQFQDEHKEHMAALDKIADQQSVINVLTNELGNVQYQLQSEQASNAIHVAALVKRLEEANTALRFRAWQAEMNRLILHGPIAVEPK